MLDSHPELAIPPETGFLSLGTKFNGEGDQLRQDFFRTIINFPAEAPCWPDFEIPEETFWAALTQLEPFTVPDGYRIFYSIYAGHFRKRRWGDKTPLYCLHLDTIRETLPEARFIHIIRDGRDAALSLRQMWFSPGWAIETQAAHWRKYVLAAREAGLNRPDYIEIRYEDLILKTRETLKQICGFIDLDYSDAMLGYHRRAALRLRQHKGRSNPDGTSMVTQERRLDQQRLTTEPPDARRVFAWKAVMSSDEKQRFKLSAGDLLEELDYED
jgi:hypothetical protein